MAETADYTFFKSLNADVFDLTPKILDELHLALEHSENPIDQTMQVISEMHGPYNGSSESLLKFSENFSKKMGKFDSAMSKTQISIKNRVSQIQEITKQIQSTISLINRKTAHQMDTPTLRAFVGEAQKLNPLVNDMIQRDIGKFPMFQQVSESIGMFYNIHVTRSMVDPRKTLEMSKGYDYTTSRTLRKPTYQKLFRPISEMLETSNRMTDAMAYRCLPPHDMSNFHSNYSNEKPITHGFHNCQDVFHQKRMIGARDGVLIKLINQFGDQLRLLNTFFPVTVSVDFATESREIDTEHGKVLVDEHGRNYGGYTQNAVPDNLDAMGSSHLKKSIKL